MMKKERQTRILELIRTHKFETQDDVLAKLLEEGYKVTQATISRDLRELQLVKSLNQNGTYTYAQSFEATKASMPSFSAVLTDSVKTVNYAGNMIVIKTYPGMAQAVATCVDGIETGEILGCVAGDDTILIVSRNETSACEIAEYFRSMRKK